MKRIVVIFIAWAITLCMAACESSDYKAATELFSQGKYEASYNAFKALGKQKDAEHKADESAYCWAKQLLSDGNWEEAVKVAKTIVTNDSKLTVDLSVLLVQCDLAKAEELLISGKHKDAIEICQKILKEQTNSNLVVAADNLRRKCLDALESGNADDLLKEASSEYEKKNWQSVISLCEQIFEIAPGTEIATSAEELRKQANLELENEVSKLMASLEDAYSTSKWEKVIDISSNIIESYSDFEDEVLTATKYLDEATQKMQEIVVEKLKPALEKLNEEYDEVEATTWYMPSSEPRYINDYCVSYLYIGQRENRSPWLRWRTILVDNEWLFFDELIINVDGVVYSVICKYDDIVRDSNRKNYWEYVDFQPKSSDLDIIRAIIDSEKTVIRFSNDDEDKIYDYTVSQKEKDGFKEVLEAFELMKYQG